MSHQTKSGGYWKHERVSEGDDEKLRIWNVKTKKIHQLISDQLGRWGQITAIQWLADNSSAGAQLCFGTGRGFVLIYRQKKDEVRPTAYNRNLHFMFPKEKFVELSNASILPFNEPVESLAFNRNRVVISGHAGKVMLFQLDKNGMILLQTQFRFYWLKIF